MDWIFEYLYGLCIWIYIYLPIFYYLGVVWTIIMVFWWNHNCKDS